MIAVQTMKLSQEISNIILDFTDDIQNHNYDMDRGDLQGMTEALALKIISLVRGAK